jgi:hypothetical protein
MRRIRNLLAMAGIIGGAVWINDARLRAEMLKEPLGKVLERDFRGFVTHRFNPVVLLLGLAGGRRSVWGVVEHVGRASGRIYHTPILPFVHEDHVYIRLTHGTDVHLVRNVRASGHCRLQAHELVYELDEPLVVGPDANPFVPRWARPFIADRRYLRLHVLDVAPGTFIHPREIVEEHAEAEARPVEILHPHMPDPEDAIIPS